MPYKQHWRSKKPYVGKPHLGFGVRGGKGVIEDWEARMASRYTIVEVRCSTDPQPGGEPLHTYKRHEPQEVAWANVVEHVEYQCRMGVLQPGKWCITMPGTDRRHSFEVT